MEIRVLRYFLAVAREESISGAADYLHLTQPTLSRQLMDLEEELGKKLFLRGSRKVTLTEDGLLLRKRAEEILDLVEKTQSEFHEPESPATSTSAAAKPRPCAWWRRRPGNCRRITHRSATICTAATPRTFPSGWTRACWTSA